MKKEKLEKEKIELKQIIDKVLWKVDESQKNENDLNVSISSLLAEEASLKNNIERYTSESKDLDERKSTLLSEDKTPDTPSSNMRNKLKTLLQEFYKKIQLQ